MNLPNTHQQRSIFETVKKISDNGQEYWSARDLQSILGYVKWDKFVVVIAKAKDACINSGNQPQNHFLRMEKMVEIGSETERPVFL